MPYIFHVCLEDDQLERCVSWPGRQYRHRWRENQCRSFKAGACDPCAGNRATKSGCFDWVQLVWLCLPRYLRLWMIHCQSKAKRNQRIKVSLSASPALGGSRLQRDPAPCSSRTRRARMLLWGGAGNWSHLYTLCRVKSKLSLSPSAAFKPWPAGQREGGRDCFLLSGKEWINTAGKIFLLLSNCKT